MNNKIILGVVIAVVVIAGAVLLLNKGYSSQPGVPTQPQRQTQTNPTTETPVPVENAVSMENMAFSPATVTIKLGDKVTWTNQDSVGHSATADDDSFDTGVLVQGQAGTTTFNKAGRYTYHCSVHPGMKATIVVE